MALAPPLPARCVTAAPPFASLVNFARLAALAAATLPGGALLGCASDSAMMRRVEDMTQTVTAKMRGRGEKSLADPAQVAQELQCGTGGVVPVRLEASELLPERARAGREIHHRVVIAACAMAADETAATLVRRIRQGPRTLFEDRTAHTLKPGRWASDVFIGIPAQTAAGAYRLEVRLELRPPRRGPGLEAATEFTLLAP